MEEKNVLEQAAENAAENNDPAKVYDVCDFNRPLTYREFRNAFLNGGVIYTNNIEQLREAAIANEDDEIVSLTSITLDFRNEFKKASVADSAQHLADVIRVAKIFNYYAEANRIGEILKERLEHVALRDGNAESDTGVSLKPRSNRGFEYGD